MTMRVALVMRLNKHNTFIPLLFLGALAACPALAADAFTATASGGYARILFRLDPTGDVRAQMTGGILTVSFPHKVGINPAAIAQALPGYIASARADADGKTFRFALTQSARLHISAGADRSAVDLMPAGFNGTPPELAPSAHAAPPSPVDVSKLDILKVRSGAYQNFSRVVFDWPREVPYSVSPGAGRLTVRFGAPVKPDFSAIERQAPPWVKATGWHIEGNSTVVDLTTDSDSGFHDFRDGTHIVVDVLAPKTDADAYRPPGDAKPKITAFAGPAPASGKPAVSPALKDAVQKAADKMNGVALSPPKPLASGKPEAAPATPPAGIQAVDVKLTKDGATLTLAGAGGRSAAVFVRGTTAWIVLAGAPPFDIATLKAKLDVFPDEADAVTANGVSVLRLLLKKPLEIATQVEGDNLKIVLAPKIAFKANDIVFTRNQDDYTHTILTAQMSGAARAVLLNDPTVKDRLIAIPASLGQASLSERNFVEFAALPTAAGAVFSPYVDDLSVVVSGQKVTVTRTGGLSLTQDTTPAIALPERAAAGDASFLDFARWGVVTNGSFLATERALRAEAAKRSGAAANGARLALARFYLANGFSAETLGLVAMLQASNPSPGLTTQLQIMRAAADYRMGRYKEAHNALAPAAFDADRHAALWRGLIDAALENSGSAFENFERAMPVLGRYRPEVQAEARIAAAGAALDVGKPDYAKTQIGRLPSAMPASLKPEADLVRARLAATWGQNGEADRLFAAVGKSGNEEAAARAIFYRVDAGLKSGHMADEPAINALERLRFRWRGDLLEMKTLSRLAALYFKQKRWRNGLATLRVAARNFAANDIGLKAQDDMRTVFTDLYLGGKADTMAPAEALGLFYDYIDLTPIGAEGDEMIRRMADRLAKVDLMGPATDLLKYQVNKRLDGMARAQVAARLAMYQLVDHKPKDALDTLLTTNISAMPDDVAHQRLMLQTQALAELKRWDEAIDLIDVDTSPDTARLRADIYWKSGNWEVAGQKAEQLLGNRWHDPAALIDDERLLAMRAAIAYSMAGDETGLDRVRARFTVKMNQSTDAKAFAVITQRIDMQGMAFRDAAAKVASVDTLQSFMNSLKKN
jgi:hypothetical protein